MNNFQTAVLLALLIIAGCSDVKPLRVSQPVEPFSLANLQGNEINTASNRGKTTVVYFWNDQCGCVEQLIKLKPFITTRDGQKFSFLTVNAGQGKKTVEGFVSGNQLPYEVLLDTNLKITEKRFGVNVLPTIFIIDRNGILRKKLIGMVDSKRLETIISKYL